MSGTTKNTTSPAKDKTYTVGCKLPHGIKLRLDRSVEEKGSDGKVANIRSIAVGKPVVLNGVNSSKVIGGYGITRDVPAEFFDEWMKQNADFQPVATGLIFKQDTPDKAADQAEEQSEIKSGLEGMDPEKPGTNLAPAEKD